MKKVFLSFMMMLVLLFPFTMVSSAAETEALSERQDKTMEEIIVELETMIYKNIAAYLPEVKSADLEEHGTIYYMNGQDGTEFFWYVNECLPPLCVFYDDEEKLGAVTLYLYKDGRVAIYIFADHGKELKQTVEEKLDVSEEEVLKLAVLLRNNMDDKSILDSSTQMINTQAEVTEEQIKEFQKNADNYTEFIAMKETYAK